MSLKEGMKSVFQTRRVWAKEGKANRTQAQQPSGYKQPGGPIQEKPNCRPEGGCPLVIKHSFSKGDGGIRESGIDSSIAV